MFLPSVLLVHYRNLKVRQTCGFQKKKNGNILEMIALVYLGTVYFVLFVFCIKCLIRRCLLCQFVYIFLFIEERRLRSIPVQCKYVSSCTQTRVHYCKHTHIFIYIYISLLYCFNICFTFCNVVFFTCQIILIYYIHVL